MKFAIASLLATTSAMHIRSQAQAADTCNSNYERLMSQKDETLAGDFVKQNMKGGKFVDPSFKPDTSMLFNSLQTGRYNKGQVAAYQGTIQSPGVFYKRPTEVNEGTLSLWGSEGINPKISEQGYDGDCWFLSSASALAAYPERVKAMFPGQDKYSEDGVYQVRLFLRGEPVNVIVDDIIPVYGYSHAAGYNVNYPPLNNSPSKAGAWWLVILEKAMAKLNINYLGINGGQVAEAMRYMTGMPTVQYDAPNLSPQKLWDIVNDGLAHDYNMGAACRVSHFNMIPGHAYGVIGAVELKGGAHDGKKLIKMRNPWGSNKYDGPWSEKSSDWTADYRKQADDYGTRNIGEMWIPIELWSDDYATLSVNYFNPDWKTTEVEGMDLEYKTNWKQYNTWITFDNPVEQDVVLECLQNEARLFPDDCDSENSPLDFIFQWFDEKLSSLTSIGNSRGSCDGDAKVIKNLPAGKTQVRMVNMAGSNAGHKTLFKLKAYAEKEGVKMTQATGNTYVYV